MIALSANIDISPEWDSFLCDIQSASIPALYLWLREFTGMLPYIYQIFHTFFDCLLGTRNMASLLESQTSGFRQRFCKSEIVQIRHSAIMHGDVLWETAKV